MKNKLCKLLFPILILIGANTPAANAEEKWDYTFSPLYLWATGIEGESRIGPGPSLQRFLTGNAWR
jgi:hypothetical protein